MHASGRFIDTTTALLALVACLVLTPATTLTGQDYDHATRGTRWLESQTGGTVIKVLVEASNLGSADVEVAEITFQAGSVPERPHTHAAIEIFYVLEGQLVHVVNGDATTLDPGMVGIVRPGDDVIHQVPGDDPVRALVIWAPGGEADRIAKFFDERPVGSNP